jgi:hypothetical protein
MIIRGAVIHRDGHGKCGLLFHQIFHSLAGLAASSFSFSSSRDSTKLADIAPIDSLQTFCCVSPNISCPAGTQERRGL